MNKLFLFFLLLFAASSYADIYEQIDAHNNSIIYSDVPLSDSARKIDNELSSQAETSGKTSNNNTESKDNLSQVVASVDPNDAARKPYTVFAIKSPKNQETIQNQPTIPVTIDINPDLQAGDKIQLIFDGQENGSPAATNTFTINTPERGTHTVSANLMDKNLKIIRESNVVTFFSHQAHLGGK